MTFSLKIKTPADLAADVRNMAGLTKTAFGRAMFDAGVLSREDTLTAISGHWPASFRAMISDMPDAQQLDLEIYWRDAETVYRTDFLLLQVVAFMNDDPALPNISDTQLDGIFGLN